MPLRPSAARRRENEQELRQSDRDVRRAGRSREEDPAHSERPGARASQRPEQPREVPGLAVPPRWSIGK
jgi:hypothetical protein